MAKIELFSLKIMVVCASRKAPLNFEEIACLGVSGRKIYGELVVTQSMSDDCGFHRVI